MPKVGASDGEEKEEVQQFWLLTNMMHFDNVGFSKVVDSTIKVGRRESCATHTHIHTHINTHTYSLLLCMRIIPPSFSFTLAK